MTFLQLVLWILLISPLYLFLITFDLFKGLKDKMSLPLPLVYCQALLTEKPKERLLNLTP